MKRLFSVIMIAVTLFFMASCVIEVNDPRYSITLYNNTDATITDWCVKKNGITTYANSSYNCEVKPGKEDKIDDLKAGEYQIFFSFKETHKLHEDDYQETGIFKLDEDVTFYLAQREVYGNRSAAGASSEVTKQHVLILSNGQEIELQPCK